MSIATQGPTTVSVEIAGREITFESGKLAKQADGAVVVREGDTVVLATAQGKAEAREGADFFPLTVDVEERMYAAGKIPGGFFKREGRPTEKAILTARMIDRPIRPLWPKGFKNEVQVICTTLSADLVVPHDILAINGASAALMISPLPFMGPVGAVRVGRIDGDLVVNPTLAELEEGTSDLDLIVVGTKDALTMVEAGANEIPEEQLLEALERAHEEVKKLCEVQEELRERVGKAKWLDNELTEELDRDHGDKIRQRIGAEGLREGSAAVDEIVEELCPPLSMESTEDEIIRRMQVRASLAIILERARLAAVETPVSEQFEDDLHALTEAEQDPKELKSAKRHLLFDRIEEQVRLPFPVATAAADAEEPVQKDTITRQYVKKAAEALYKGLVRRKIAVEKRRPDGRGSEDIRPITCEVGVAPRPHGSALFTRGQTQIMTLLTLGTAKEGQRIDDLSLETDRRYMHHYNFPPYSVGETGFMRGPKRRDIGHGALAQRALEPMIPPLEEFPYTIRLVSETLESNGSSSMGSVCGSTLALMDAGVPIKAPVSGIAMGLVKEGDDYVILTDIQGAEDHLGDMDFKVAGTEHGITSIQMDIKIEGLSFQIVQEALAQAREGRLHILGEMSKALAEPRADLSQYAPRIYTMNIATDKIRDVIGPGGKVIRGIIEQTGVKIDVSDDGTIHIASADEASASKAMKIIGEITAVAEVGKTYLGKVVRLVDFGAFVEIFPGTDGLLHISEIAENRIKEVRDELKEGDQILVKVLALEGNKIKLSRKAVLREQREKLKVKQ